MDEWMPRQIGQDGRLAMGVIIHKQEVWRVDVLLQMCYWSCLIISRIIDRRMKGEKDIQPGWPIS